MASLDVFHQDPFTAIQLTAAVDKIPFQPTGLGAMNIFEDEPIRTRALAVEQRQGKLVLLPFSQPGEPGAQRSTELRTARYFEVPRVKTEDTLWASELQSIREFGSESELMQVQREVARRLSGPTGLMRNVEYTWEYHRLAAIQGLLLDANGAVYKNWFNEFEISQPAEIGFNLAGWQSAGGATAVLSAAPTAPLVAGAQLTIGGTAFAVSATQPIASATVSLTLYSEVASGAAVTGTSIPGSTTLVSLLPVIATPDGSLRKLCNQIVRIMARASQGAFLPTTRVAALCGDTFWDQLVTHPDVTKTYFNWVQAQELRQGTAFEAMPFGGIDWFNYRGSDDATTIAVPPDKCKFFPVGAPGVFKRALRPHENFDFVNTLGRPVYVIPEIDLQLREWWRMNVYSYPLHICVRPEVLLSGRSEV